MRTQTRSGFTIIEVMLFLAITGALTVAILAGSGAAINRQRYRDSVNTFKGLIQEQYGQIANVVNSEIENPICNESGDSLAFGDQESQTLSRGMSDCLVVGRFVLVEPTQVTVHSLIGRPASDTLLSSDSETLRTYAFATQSPETYEIGWKAGVVKPKTDDGATVSILMVRSPRSGSILTYIQDGDQTGLIKSMINDDYMEQKDFCIDPDYDSGGLRIAGPRRLAVRINAKASGQSAVEIPPESESVCDL